jgi:DNA-binding HxlR family transcriptional regulator
VVLKANVLDPNCPSRLVLDRVAEKWTGLVVLALSDGTLRFGELRQRIGGVAPKVLTQTLRNLERDGLVTRTIHAEMPPRVEYALTDLGRSLREPLTAVQSWAEANVDQVLANRDRADAAAEGKLSGTTSHP